MDERREDWHHGVDENLASLNAGQRVWDRENTLFRKEVSELKSLLLGDAQKETDGLIARLHQIENQMNLFRAILLKDAAGMGGLVGRVEAIESGERRADSHLKLWIAIVGFLSAATVAGITNIDRIEKFFKQTSTDPVDKMIERTRHPKSRHRHVVIQQRQEPGPEQEESSEN